MNIVLMYGGRSGEHEISLLSCASVARNVSSKHNVKLISVDKDGKWYLEDDSVLKELKNDSKAVLKVHANKENRVSIVPGSDKNSVLVANGKTIPCDVVFPVMHGTYSEDGTIQGLFEMAGLPYVGCQTLSSAATMDKEFTKILWKNAGLPVVPYVCMTRTDVNNKDLYDAKFAEAIEMLQFPLFVKPCCAGSSDGASKANNERELSMALAEAFMWDNKVLIEKAIDAREVECSVTGNSVTVDSEVKETELKAYGPGEIVPNHEFYDYDAKYNDPNGASLKIPALLDDQKLGYIRATAKKAYSAVNAAGLSRVDFFIDRKSGEIYLNEINTMPGFTSISMFPKMCESEGLKFCDLVDLLCTEALSAFDAKNKLTTSRQ